MTGVPDPRVPPGLWLEVGPADVVDLGGEAEQASVSVGPVGLGCRFGQAVLLCSTVEHVQRPILDVDRLLDQRRVQDEVRGGWGRTAGSDWSSSNNLINMWMSLRGHSLSEQMTPAANFAADFWQLTVL